MHTSFPRPVPATAANFAADVQTGAQAPQNVSKRQHSPEGSLSETYKKLCVAGGSTEAALRAQISTGSAGGSVARIDNPEQISATIAQARAHVDAKKEQFQNSNNHHVRSAVQMLDRTLCLASNFNQGASTLSSFASDGTSAGHYIRSFQHDLLISDTTNQTVVTSLVDKGVRKTSGLAANAGQIPNVYSHLLSQFRELDIEGKPVLTSADVTNRPASRVRSNAGLYDASLKYRNEATQFVTSKLKNAQHIEVGAYNDYPAVMVHFDASKFLPENTQIDDASAESFNQFLMSHYLGIVNVEAAKMGLDTATVERSSFGHLTPSVAVTAGSFRINLGTMLPAYAQAHAKALEILDQELAGLKQSIDAGGFDNKHEERLGKAANGAKLKNAKNILALAFTPAERSGGTLISNTMRTLRARNFVDATSFHAHAQPSGGAAAGNAIVAGLDDLFAQVSAAKVNGKMRLSTKAPEVSYDMTTVGATTGSGADTDMAVDDPKLEALARSYASYLGKFSKQFAAIATAPGNETNRHIGELARTLHPGNTHIAGALDLANQMLMVHTLDRMDTAPAPEIEPADRDYGSDSDVEDGGIRGNKMIVHNGLRSLVGATDSARVVLFGADAAGVGAAFDRPYYETGKALAGNKIKVSDVGDEKSDAAIVIKDLNPCVTDADPGQDTHDVASAYPNAKAWIIDTTSASKEQMQDVYRQFKEADNAELLYFASSGLKNEQAGADQNNYGTVRVFAKSIDAETGEARVGRVTGAIAQHDHGIALFAQEHRRTMKAMGLVPSNRDIVVPVQNDIVMADVPSADA